MKTKDVLETLQRYLESASEESLAQDWERLKVYNTGVLVSDFFARVMELENIPELDVKVCFKNVVTENMGSDSMALAA